MPWAVEPPFTPLTDQVTEVFALPTTVAATTRFEPSGTVADEGDTVTVTAGGGAETVTVAPAKTAEFAAKVARTDTVPAAGRVPGAV